MPSVLGGDFEIILYVQNMDPEVHFYRDVLGLPIRYPQDLEDYSAEMWVEFELDNGTLALHGGANQQPDDLHEIVFMVTDVAQTREKIIAAGIPMAPMRDLEDGFPIVLPSAQNNCGKFAQHEINLPERC